MPPLAERPTVRYADAQSAYRSESSAFFTTGADSVSRLSQNVQAIRGPHVTDEHRQSAPPCSLWQADPCAQQPEFDRLRSALASTAGRLEIPQSERSELSRRDEAREAVYLRGVSAESLRQRLD